MTSTGTSPLSRVERDTNAARAPLGRPERWSLAALILGAALVRIAVIWMPGDPMLENGHLPFEEVMRGNATWDFMRGTLLPFLEYQTNHFSGGSLVISILALPLFLVAGPIFPVLRLASLCFSLPLVLATFALVDRRHGRRAAWIAAALLAFAPPGYQFLNCTVYGTHLEGNVLTIALVLLYLRWRDANGSSARSTLCLGLAAGFAVWFGYGQCVVVFVLAALELARSGWRGVRAHALPFGLGFVVGFGPWIGYMLDHPDRAFHIYGASFVEHLGRGIVFASGLEKQAELFVTDGPRAFWLHGANEGIGIAIARIFFWTILLAIARAAWMERAHFVEFLRAIFVPRARFTASLRFVSLSFVLAWFTAFGLSDFRVDMDTWIQGYRYLMPFVPFVAILAAMALADVQPRAARRGVLVAVALACATNVAATLAQCQPERWASHARAPATSTRWHTRMIVARFGADAPAMLSILRRIDERRRDPERTELVEGLALGIALGAQSREDDSDAVRVSGAAFAHSLEVLAGAAPEPFRAAFARRLAQSREDGALK